MYRFAIRALTTGAIVLITSAAMAAVMTFDSVPVGTVYGAPVGTPPGVTVLTEDGINMSMDRFFWYPPGSGFTYNFAEVISPFHPLAVNLTNALNTNNINAVFDFSAFPAAGPVNYASVDFVESGGNVNFEVNNTGLQNVQDFPALMSPPGYIVNVLSAPTPGGYRGVIEVGRILSMGVDPIHRVLVGGQELGIDNILASKYGDVNKDGTVNGLDVTPFVKVLINGPYMLVADMNQDHQINGLDVKRFVAAVISGGAQSVPEPASALLAGIGLLGLLLWRKRRG